MIILRDVGFGALMWLTTLLLMGGNFVGWMYFVGPPQADRERSAVFIAGGCGALVSLIILGLIIGFAAHQVYSRS